MGEIFQDRPLTTISGGALIEQKVHNIPKSLHSNPDDNYCNIRFVIVTQISLMTASDWPDVVVLVALIEVALEPPIV